MHRDVNDERMGHSHLTHSPGKRRRERERESRIYIPVLGKRSVVKKGCCNGFCMTFDDLICLDYLNFAVKCVSVVGKFNETDKVHELLIVTLLVVNVFCRQCVILDLIFKSFHILF